MTKTKVILNKGEETEKVVTIRKLGLGRYRDLLNALEGSEVLPDLIKMFEGNSEGELVAMLPKIVGQSFPDIVKLLSIATKLPVKDFDDDIDLNDSIKLLKAILEVNNFGEIKKNIQDMLQGTNLKETVTAEIRKRTATPTG